MTKQTNVTQHANTAPQQLADGAVTGGLRARLKGAFHRAVDKARYVVMNKHFALAASMGIPAVIAIANGVPVETVALGALVASAAGAGAVVDGDGVAAGAVGAGAIGVATAAAAVGAVGAVGAAGVARLAAQNKARQDRKSDVDIQKAGRGVATIGTAAGAFAAACMTAGAIHVYGINMPERAPADAAPKPTPTASIQTKDGCTADISAPATLSSGDVQHIVTLSPGCALSK